MIEIIELLVICLRQFEPSRDRVRFKFRNNTRVFGKFVLAYFFLYGKTPGNKGYDCALSAIEMVNLVEQL